MMTKQVFISYRSTERGAAQQLSESIKQAGNYTVWIDQTGIIGGQDWWDTILGSIRHADIVVLALSNDYLASEACYREYTYAIALGKAVIPISIDANLDYNSLHGRWGPLQRRQIVRHDKNQWEPEKLAAALEGAQSAPLPNPLPDAPDAPIDAPESPISAMTKPRFNLNELRAIILAAMIGVAGTIAAAIITSNNGSGTSPTLPPSPTVASVAQPDPTPSIAAIPDLPTESVPTGLPGDFSVIYDEADRLTLLFETGTNVRSIMVGSTAGESALVDDFSVLAQRSGIITAGTCLTYMRDGAAPPLPRACDEDTTFSLSLPPADIFWYDDAIARPLDVFVRRFEALEVCPASAVRCDF